jgi:hypothetical protein
MSAAAVGQARSARRRAIDPAPTRWRTSRIAVQGECRMSAAAEGQALRARCR